VAPGCLQPGEGGPEWPQPLRAPSQCSPRGREPTSPPPGVTAWPDHLLVLDPEGSRPWRSPAQRGSPCPTPAPLCVGGLQLWAPRWWEPSVCSSYRGGAHGASLLRLEIRWQRRRKRDPWHRGGFLRCGSSTGGRQVLCQGHRGSSI
jgi:hypothetical protein